MLRLPVYLRGNTYYLHTRIGGRQVKKSLRTSDRKTAIILASQLLSQWTAMTIKKFEIDLRNGVYKSDGPEDFERMREALNIIQNLPPEMVAPKATRSESVSISPPAKPVAVERLTLPGVLEKYLQLKKHLKPATVLAYKNTVSEFASFHGNFAAEDYDTSDITRFQEHSAEHSEVRTIDNKTSILCSIFNFAIKQGYYFKPNPAAGRKLMTNKQRAQQGYHFFEPEQITLVFGDEFKKWKVKDPDFYYSCLTALITGARISEITGMLKEQLKESPVPHLNIPDSKTPAGIRKVSLPPAFFAELLEFAKGKGAKDQVFKYQIRLGKGSGNAVGQKFGRHLKKIGIEDDKLVFHSLRKFFNDFIPDEITMQARCQFVGHEFNHVNVKVYRQELPIEKLASLFVPVQNRILKLIGL